MNKRVAACSLLALAAVLFGGLRWWASHLREEEARARAERLNQPPIRMAQTSAPVSEDGTIPAPLFVPAQKVAAVLSGKVLRVADDSPIGGAVIEVLGEPGPDGRSPLLCLTNTVIDGRFAITAQDPRATALRIWASVDYHPAQPPPEGHAGYMIGECVVKTVPLPSAAEQRLDLVVRVDTGWVLSGTVTDTTGKVVTGGTVSIVEPRGFSTIDAEGHYLLRDLPPDGKPLSVSASGIRVRSATVEVPEAPVEGKVVVFDFQLAPAGMIHGRVTWRRGSAQPNTAPIITLLNPPEGAVPGSTEMLVAAVDGEGNYQLDGLASGRWNLSCAWTQFESQQQSTCATYALGIEVGPGELVQHDFALPGNAGLDIQLTGAGGEPLAGYQVDVGHVLDPADPQSRVLREGFLTAGADGRCRLNDLEPGTKELAVRGPPKPPQPGEAPTPIAILATQRVAVVDGPNPVTVVVGAR